MTHEIPFNFRRELGTAIIDPENDFIPTINADPTKFDLSSGIALICDAVTDPEMPTTRRSFYPGATAITPAFAAGGAPVSFIYVDNVGNLVQTSTIQSGAFLRSHVGVAIISHEGSTTITDVSGFTPVVSANMPNTLADLTFALGAINCSPNCNLISGSPGTLKLNKSEGDWYFFAINSRNNLIAPNIITTAALVEPTLLVGWRSTDEPNNQHIAPLAAIPGGVYDDGTADSGDLLPQGTLLNNRWINTRVFHLTDSNRLLAQIGQEDYISSSQARAAVRSENFIEIPATRGTTPVATITMRGGAIDLTDGMDAIITQALKTGDFV